MVTDKKITADILSAQIWAGYNILRGSLDIKESFTVIATLFFLKRLDEIYQNNDKKNQRTCLMKNIVLPPQSSWSVLRATTKNVSNKIFTICHEIERENPQLDGLLTNFIKDDYARYPDEMLFNIISHFDSLHLRNEDLQNNAVAGEAFEILLERFALATRKVGLTVAPKEVTDLMVEILQPHSAQEICDPICGSGSILIQVKKYIESSEGSAENVTLEGQDINYDTSSICKINFLLHDIDCLGIECRNIFRFPKILQDGTLRK